MRKIFCVLILSLCNTIVFAQDNLSAQKVLENLSDKLNSLKTVRYDYHWITNVPSKHIYLDIFGKVYFDFSSASHNKEKSNSFNAPYKLDCTYQVTDRDDYPIAVYSGTGFFSIDRKEASMHVVRQPYISNYGVLQLSNSLASFRKDLLLVIADTTAQKTLNDTAIAGKNYYLVTIVLKNKTIVSGRFIPNRLPQEIYPRYNIAIDKKTFLPLFINQPSIDVRHPNDYSLYKYDNYDFDYKPKEDTWSYTIYEKDYKATFTEH